jgi:hypothetical protein
MQPPYYHIRVGAPMPTVEKLAMTVVLSVRVRVQLPVPEHPPPFQPAKVDPLAATALRVTPVPLV